MTSNPRRARDIESDIAVHPGEFLAEELEARGMTQKALAEAMRRPTQAINEIVRGKKAISAETAVQLEAVLRVSAQMWLALQSRYDLVLARRAQAARTAAAPARPRLAMAVAEPAREYRARPGAKTATPRVKPRPAAKRG